MKAAQNTAICCEIPLTTMKGVEIVLDSTQRTDEPSKDQPWSWHVWFSYAVERNRA